MTPKGMGVTRPTSGKVRQALFNILRGRIEEGDFLDLYAGSGAVGFEAFSRGCRSATLVENHAVAWRALSENGRLLVARGAETGSLNLVRQEALEFCLAAARMGRRFRAAFADPPFAHDFSPIWAAMRPLLEEEGMGIVQFPTRKPPDFAATATRIYRYGESSLAVFDAAH